MGHIHLQQLPLEFPMPHMILHVMMPSKQLLFPSRSMRQRTNLQIFFLKKRCRAPNHRRWRRPNLPGCSVQYPSSDASRRGIGTRSHMGAWQVQVGFHGWVGLDPDVATSVSQPHTTRAATPPDPVSDDGARKSPRTVI
ncbi:hypothetical protein SEVIR_9G345266v4 [Setaria viridis]